MCVNCDIDFKSLETEFGTNRIPSWVAMGVLFDFESCEKARRWSAEYLVRMERDYHTIIFTESNLIPLLTCFPGDLLFKFLLYRTPIVSGEEFFKVMAERISSEEAALFCRSFLSVDPITAKFVGRDWVLTKIFISLAQSIPQEIFREIVCEVAQEQGDEQFKKLGKEVLFFLTTYGGYNGKVGC